MMKKLSGSCACVSSPVPASILLATYTHVLFALDHPCQLWAAMLQRDKHVIDGENLVVIAIDKQHLGARLFQSAVVKQREFPRVLDEGFKVGVAKLVCEGACEIEGILQRVDVFKPLPIKHLRVEVSLCMTSPTSRNNPHDGIHRPN